MGFQTASEEDDWRWVFSLLDEIIPTSSAHVDAHVNGVIKMAK